uniref:Secreted protein n=1 Tax=Fundulus heteroclitus TaxID=8078 RepID=A0A3Q2P7F7_FUNHE
MGTAMISLKLLIVWVSRQVIFVCTNRCQLESASHCISTHAIVGSKMELCGTTFEMFEPARLLCCTRCQRQGSPTCNPPGPYVAPTSLL